MKSQILIFLLVLISTFSYSTDKIHYINLEKASTKLRNPGFQLIAVTNATGEKNRIGFVEKGISYKDVPAFFSRGIKVEVSAFIQRNLLITIIGDSLFIRVNEIKIAESYDGVNESGIAIVGLTFIYKKNGRYFEKFTTVEQSKVVIMAGVTKKQPANIANAIAGCFNAFYERALEDKLSNIEIEESNLSIAPSNDKELLEAYLNADRSTKGIYKTHLDFKENTPDLSRAFDIDYKTKLSGNEEIQIKYAKITDKLTGRKIKDIWGFTDGELPYIAVRNKFLPLQKNKESYYAEIKYQDPNAAMAAGIAGGLIGSGIAFAAAPIRQIKLDYYTGKFNYGEQSIEEVERRNETYNRLQFFSSAFNASSSLLKLYINDTLRCSLKKRNMV